MRRLVALGALGVIGLVGAGCGLGLLQTAKTTPAGELDVSIGVGYIHNEMVSERGVSFSNVPTQVGMRYGLSEHWDMGVGLFMAGGVTLDAKVNFLGPQDALAVAVQFGLGVAKDFIAGASDAVVVQLPLRALVSYSALDGWLTPYASLGYLTFWISGYQSETDLSDVRLAEREGHGDGILSIALGLELFGTRAVKLLLEYDYWHPVLDDPGDRFSFVDNHIFLVGMRF